MRLIKQLKKQIKKAHKIISKDNFELQDEWNEKELKVRKLEDY